MAKHSQPPQMQPAQYGRASYGQAVIENHRERTHKRWRITFWIALLVMVVCLAAIGFIVFNYLQGQQAYDKIADEAAFNPPTDAEQVNLADLSVDWDALRAINSDVVAWIYVPGTNINYPVVQGTDNEKYLKTDFYGTTNWVVSDGCIFLEYTNSPKFTDANSIMYGHNMNDGSMFASLSGLENQSAFDASRTVFVLTPNGNFKLKTFALDHVAADDPLVQTSFASVEEMTEYVQDKIDRSSVAADDIPAASEMHQIFGFSTCDNLASNGRWVLFAYIEESTVAGTLITSSQAAGEITLDEAQAITDAANAADGASEAAAETNEGE